MRSSTLNSDSDNHIVNFTTVALSTTTICNENRLRGYPTCWAKAPGRMSRNPPAL